MKSFTQIEDISADEKKEDEPWYNILIENKSVSYESKYPYFKTASL